MWLHGPSGSEIDGHTAGFFPALKPLFPPGVAAGGRRSRGRLANSREASVKPSHRRCPPLRSPLLPTEKCVSKQRRAAASLPAI